MSGVWFKNFVGIRQTDYELLQVSRPGTEMAIHITFRCVQTGVLLGSLIGPLAVLLFENNRNRDRLKQAVVSGGLCGAGMGLVLGPTITFGSIRGMSTPRLYNRVYQLRFDTSQLFVDRCSAIGGAVGLATHGPLGLVLGVDLAVITALIIGRLWN